jgi:hypothetical protein
MSEIYVNEVPKALVTLLSFGHISLYIHIRTKSNQYDHRIYAESGPRRTRG